MSSKFECTRCGTNYKYKGGLTAHIKRKHPIRTEPATTVDPKSPVSVVKKNTWKVSNLNTQEVDNLLEHEESFYDAIDDFEHGIGINSSMVDWCNVNFASPFSNSGEFEGRMASVAQREKCTDCEINSKTLNMQTDLITKLDKKLQDSQDQLKASRKKEKQLEIKLSDALKNNKRFEHINVNKSAAYSIKCRECQFVCETEEELKEHKRNKKAEYRAQSPTYNKQLEEGPLNVEDSKCGKCNFVNKNRVLLEEHKEKNHSGIKCTRCEVISPDLQSFKKHGELQHEFPVYSLMWECNPCKKSFKTFDDHMEHMSQVHLTESQREGHGLSKYHGSGYENNSNNDRRPPLCRNGNQCYYYRQNRCNFFHHQPPQRQQGRPHRQAPSSQWQEVPSRRQQFQNGQFVQQPHVQQAQGHRYWSVPPQGVQSTPWCLHGRGCPMGKYCVLRHEDFPNLPSQGRQ